MVDSIIRIYCKLLVNGQDKIFYHTSPAFLIGLKVNSCKVLKVEIRSKLVAVKH